MSNDGKHPLLEFAMSYFRESNFEFPNADGSIKDNNKKKKKKKGAKNSDWTWKEQVRRRGPRTATGHGRNRYADL